ncbi:hypothetical protein [Dishui Lake phycodnavirus 4]|nr:hypothetical protein [Dishui Lake phycodnavirus 4]
MNEKVNVLDHGFVRLVDHMPRENMDSAIVQAARVSYGDGTKSMRDDRGLIRYLLRHWHTTPFEMVEFKFHIKMPLYIARQHFRHRTASVNELSARYSVVPEEVYEPMHLRRQSLVNHQGSEGEFDASPELLTKVSEQLHTSFDVYDELIDKGCCREQARGVLPQSTYTEFYWKINLHNLLHYLRLRMDVSAQKEIQEYAHALFKIIEPLVPHTIEAFRDFRLNTITLTGPEIECLNNGRPITSASEKREFQEKLNRLRLRIPTVF